MGWIFSPWSCSIIPYIWDSFFFFFGHYFFASAFCCLDILRSLLDLPNSAVSLFLHPWSSCWLASFPLDTFDFLFSYFCIFSSNLISSSLLLLLALLYHWCHLAHIQFRLMCIFGFLFHINYIVSPSLISIRTFSRSLEFCGFPTTAALKYSSQQLKCFIPTDWKLSLVLLFRDSHSFLLVLVTYWCTSSSPLWRINHSTLISGRAVLSYIFYLFSLSLRVILLFSTR